MDTVIKGRTTEHAMLLDPLSDIRLVIRVIWCHWLCNQRCTESQHLNQSPTPTPLPSAQQSAHCVQNSWQILKYIEIIQKFWTLLKKIFNYVWILILHINAMVQKKSGIMAIYSWITFLCFSIEFVMVMIDHLILEQLKCPEKSPFCILCPEKAFILPSEKVQNSGSKMDPVGTLMAKYLSEGCPITCIWDYWQDQPGRISQIMGVKITFSKRGYIWAKW